MTATVTCPAFQPLFRFQGLCVLFGWGQGLPKYIIPRGSTYTTIMELGPQNHNKNGILGPYSTYSIMVVYMEPLGYVI